MRMIISRITAPYMLARFLHGHKNYFVMLFYSNQAIDTRREGCIMQYMDRGISPASK